MAQFFSLVLLGCCLLLALDAAQALPKFVTTEFPMTESTFETATPPVETDTPDNPEEAADLFEGDIVGITADDVLPSGGGLSNAVRNKKKLWTNKVVPYEISNQFTKKERGMIQQAIGQFHAKTCIKFKQRKSSDKDYITIIPGTGCSSEVGRRGGRQEVTFAQINGAKLGCFQIGVLMHELMHALGFYHEQSRTDRDKWIKVSEQNIKPKYVDNFEKYTNAKIDHLGFEYDYGSLMHYGANAFSKNAKDKRFNTITPLKKLNGLKMGQRDGFSKKDLAKIKKLYKCS